MALPRILIAWEAGANYGHVAKIVAIAEAIGGRADITAVVRDPVSFRTFAPGLALRLLPAPVPPHRADEPPGWSYADNLRQLGYVSADAVAALVESWRGLYALARPDVVISEVAPTALLAARGLGIRTLHLGMGFEMPPATKPMPPFLHWSGENADRAAEGEAKVLAAINGALPRFGLDLLDSVATINDADVGALVTIPELDHYPPSLRPADQSYLGVLYHSGAGAKAEWRGEGQRVFAYLRSGNPAADATIDALGSLGRDLDIILASPGLEREAADRITAQGVQHFDGPVRLEGMLDRCDLAINHASIGTSAAFIRSGVPQIGLPSQVEQMMLAHAIGVAGIGVSVNGKATAAQMRALILDVLKSEKMRDAVRALADKYRDATPGKVAEKVARLALSLADRG